MSIYPDRYLDRCILFRTVRITIHCYQDCWTGERGEDKRNIFYLENTVIYLGILKSKTERKRKKNLKQITKEGTKTKF